MTQQTDLHPISTHIPFFQLFYSRARSLVVLRRTREPYPSIDEMGRSTSLMRDVVRPLGARRALVDMSGGPMPRNDVTFEHAGRDVRAELTQAFERVAFLMGSAVGALQANRLVREEGSGAGIFRDEAEAIAWLMQE